MRELAKIKYPGDDADPVNTKLRAAWRTRMLRYHTFALLRHRFKIASRKRSLIYANLFSRYGRRLCPPLSEARDEWAMDANQRHADADQTRLRRSRGGD